MRETWLSENQRLVSADNFGFDLAAVEAAAKKHEAIETDIFAYEERVTAVEQVDNQGWQNPGIFFFLNPTQLFFWAIFFFRFNYGTKMNLFL